MASPTLIDVARLAGVSKSTVSLVINGSDRVHSATASRVWQAIEQLNYVPNRAARALQSGRSHLIGIMVSDITNPFFAELVRSINHAAKAENYDVFVFDTDYDAQQLLHHLDHLRQHRPDGLVLLTTERTPKIVKRLEQLNLPTVLMNWGITGKRVSEVAVNYQPAMAELVAWLVDLGHHRLAFVSGPPEYHSALAREHAFRQVIETHNNLAPPLFLIGDFRLDADMGESIYARLAALAPETRPTALIASNDLMAISILRALQAHGWQVPHSISIVGIDDISLAAYVTPPLTTLRLPRQRMGQLAFDMLNTLINDPCSVATTQTVTPRLIHRDSVCTVASARD